MQIAFSGFVLFALYIITSSKQSQTTGPLAVPHSWWSLTLNRICSNVSEQFDIHSQVITCSSKQCKTYAFDLFIYFKLLTLEGSVYFHSLLQSAGFPVGKLLVKVVGWTGDALVFERTKEMSNSVICWPKWVSSTWFTMFHISTV